MYSGEQSKSLSSDPGHHWFASARSGDFLEKDDVRDAIINQSVTVPILVYSLSVLVRQAVARGHGSHSNVKCTTWNLGWPMLGDEVQDRHLFVKLGHVSTVLLLKSPTA